MSAPICLVLGAGAGIGGTVGKKFAKEGYHAVLARRSDADGLNRLVEDIKKNGGQATGRLINATAENAIEDLVADIEKNLGGIEVVLFNLGAQIGNRSLEDTALKTFTLGWQMATFALFRLAKVVIPSDGGARRRHDFGDLGHRSRQRQCRTAFACRGDGRTAHAVSDAQRRICKQGHTYRSYFDRWRRRCARYAWQTARGRKHSKGSAAKEEACSMTACSCQRKSPKPIIISRSSIDPFGRMSLTCDHFPI